MLGKFSAEHLAAWRPQLALTGILVVGALIRLTHLEANPAGLNQDEAVNSWNAWCLLHTGRDQAGEPWPVFSMRAHGVYSSPLFAYWSMPVLWLGGLSIWATRLPAALAGMLTLVLMNYVGTRMFGPATGLAAAGLLAINPWHIQQSRWGHEATLCPLLVMAAWCSLLWAGLPIMDRQERKPRVIASALSGALCGIGLYGYPAIRAYLPVLVIGMVAVSAAWWKVAIVDPDRRRSVITFLLAVLVVATPLAWKHVTDHQRIGQQFDAYRLWQPHAPLWRNAKAVLERYACHFDPDFLFLRGGVDRHLSPPTGGMFNWYVLPLFAVGCVATCSRARTSTASRVLLLAVAIYPLGDCVARYDGPHPLRSLPGLCGLILMAGRGFEESISLARKFGAAPARLLEMSLIAVMTAATFSSVPHRTDQAAADPRIYHNFHVDLVEACKWLRPRLPSADAVFVTTTDMNMPYSVMLVALGYDPQTWMTDVHDIETVNRWDHHKRFGKIHFLYDEPTAMIESLKSNGRPDRVVAIVRPGEIRLATKPTHLISGPEGCGSLEIYEFVL